MIDTLETSEKLVKEGFTDMQSRSLTRLLAEQEKRLVTKNDIHSIENDIHSIENDIHGIKNDIIKLDDKIDNVADKLNSKIDNVADKIASQSRWMIGLIVILIIAMGIFKFF